MATKSEIEELFKLIMRYEGETFNDYKEASHVFGNMFGDWLEVIKDCVITSLDDRNVWQPIETIPHDQRVLCTDGREEHVCIQYSNGVFSHGRLYATYILSLASHQGCYVPTHWMPLSKRPTNTKPPI